MCDEDDDDDDGAFFFFLTDVGASYVRKDSKDMVGVSKSSSSSLGGESFSGRGRPTGTEAEMDSNRSGKITSSNNDRKPVFSDD